MWQDLVTFCSKQKVVLWVYGTFITCVATPHLGNRIPLMVVDSHIESLSQCSGCCNKTPQTEVYFLMAFEAAGPRSGCQHGQVPATMLSLAWGCPAALWLCPLLASPWCLHEDRWLSLFLPLRGHQSYQIGTPPFWPHLTIAIPQKFLFKYSHFGH